MLDEKEVRANINSFFTVYPHEICHEWECDHESNRFDGEFPNHEAARALGWERKDVGNELGNPRWTWISGNKHLWKVGTSYPRTSLWWVCADLLDNGFRNHRTHATFNEAILLEEGDRSVIDLAIQMAKTEGYYPRQPPKHVSDFIKEWENE